jgi:hypothetical protein
MQHSSVQFPASRRRAPAARRPWVWLLAALASACQALAPVPLEVEYVDEPCRDCVRLDQPWFQLLAGDAAAASAAAAELQWQGAAGAAHQQLARDLCWLAHGQAALESGDARAAEQVWAGLGSPALQHLRRRLLVALAAGLSGEFLAELIAAEASPSRLGLCQPPAVTFARPARMPWERTVGPKPPSRTPGLEVALPHREGLGTSTEAQGRLVEGSERDR